MAQIALRAHIIGRVQGVGYRSWAKEVADRFGVAGWAKNMSNGGVEVLAAGDDQRVMAFLEACKEGPAFAEVSDIEAATEENPGVLVGFKVVG